MSNSERFQDTGMTSVFYQGVNSERERIIKLLIYKAIESRLSLRDDEADVFDFAVALIKSEQESARTHENQSNPRLTDTEKLDLRTNARKEEASE